ncbi:MAG: uracil-DNA glycosylase family protein [Opitutae bacterium]|nr:uracil-DNA glycosylase family protein [Opitutae bacterium]
MTPSVASVEKHLARLRACALCPQMHQPVVVGRPTASRIILVGQAPGDKEPVFGRPFAWTAGKTLFKWFHGALGWSEDEVRDRIYFAAVCRCFPGKKSTGGDRVPADDEIANCSRWLAAEFALLRPQLVLPVGKLAITQFMPAAPLNDLIGKKFAITYRGHAVDCIPLPHPSGASPWHRMEPGKTLLGRALALVAQHPAIRAAAAAGPKSSPSPRPARPPAKPSVIYSPGP